MPRSYPQKEPLCSTALLARVVAESDLAGRTAAATIQVSHGQVLHKWTGVKLKHGHVFKAPEAWTRNIGGI